MKSNLLLFEDVNITTSNNSYVSPYSAFGSASFNKGTIKSIKINAPTNTHIASAYTDTTTNTINVSSNKAGTFNITIGYIPK